MAKRGYKLQEFVAHSTNVNCLIIAKKACRLFITGGDDHKVNLWAIGKPTSLMSLCGHTSPVESVAFDTAEVLVLAGASAGAIKLWDLEETKLVRSLTGHRSNCTAVEFHPFGEFFASGSADTNLKIWDIRKKGCIHTYKGHTGGISNIRFTPDGRWIVSGGFDNVVKVWDLTAGKHLHDFKFHDGPIRSIDFHPLEFLLATGSADRTVKFWDLETFELIGSTRPEATVVRTITFNPDGRTLFCGLDDSLKVYSWEPVICHDTLDMGWSTLGDLCIHEGKLLGCSYYRNSVGVWVADVSLIQPYGTGFVPEENDYGVQKLDMPTSHSSDRTSNGARSLHSVSPSYETKEIKNIYVDCSSGNTAASQRERSLSPPEVVLPLDKTVMYPPAEKRSPIKGGNQKSGEQALDKSVIMPAIVPWETPVQKESYSSGREAITFTKTKPGNLLRPSHVRKPSNSKIDLEKLSPAPESVHISMVGGKASANDPSLQTQVLSEDCSEKYYEEKNSGIQSVAEKFERILSPDMPASQMNSNESVNDAKGNPSVKIVNGVAVVTGRTRTLVERFERREKLSTEDHASDTTPRSVPEPNRTPTAGADITPPVIPDTKRTTIRVSDMTPCVDVPHSVPELNRTPTAGTNITPPVIPDTKRSTIRVSDMTPCVDVLSVPEANRTPTAGTNITTPVIPDIKRTTIRVSDMAPCVDFPHPVPEPNRTPTVGTNITPSVIHNTKRTPIRVSDTTPCDDVSTTTSNMTPHVKVPTTVSYTSPRVKVPTTVSNMTSRANIPTKASNMRSRVNIVPEIDRTPAPANIMDPQATPETDSTPPVANDVAPPIMGEINKTPLVLQKEDPQEFGRELTSVGYRDVSEELMQTHDVFLSALKSRLTKLQVVRHFWERNDMKGAINALRKLPDHSVQADVISVLIEKMEILTLDLFSYLLPVLVGLLDSKTERHASLSLEILLKLVAVFGPVVRSTISAPPAVGVDLHADERRECCKECHVQLQRIQQILPTLSRRGGMLAKSALELNLVLQES